MEEGYVSVKKRRTEHHIRRKTNMKCSVSRNFRGAFVSRPKVVVKVSNSKKKSKQSKNYTSNRLSSSSTIEEKWEPVASSSKEHASTRVACIGNSNTRATGKGSYPKLLQSILDLRDGHNSYTVRSFGVTGACAAATHRKQNIMAPWLSLQKQGHSRPMLMPASRRTVGQRLLHNSSPMVVHIFWFDLIGP